MIKTKQELLNHFSDINAMYNNPFMHQTLSNMIDELLEQVKKETYIQGYDYGVKDWFKSKSQPCEDCISRSDALKLMCDKCPMYNCVTGCSSYRHIEKMPPVTPQPKTGHWEDCSNGWMCSNCYKDVSHESDFCPHCGADMRGENIDE